MIRRGNQQDRFDLMENGRADKMQESTTLLEQRNQEHISLLKDRVSALKTLAVDIGNEVKSQNRFLDEMDHSMTGLTGMFSTTMNKIGEAMSFSNGSGLCVLVVFMVAVFIFLWRVLR
ncbi:hypothetical protein AV274_3255 [Blastocystis sp. ATCC 50177/Nand II]|uniref:t-SNARE coiled-coil homology domain-containing protein n=1 Tax=Blastocystis sp. subtype 1 (strain ATCC 50177 / NandII) TaxID=478820 RepID=A0A196SGE2_BLAHN|nr:hypothetical protein AV274_3255 [Blastocystis sp. ATCC 50177/Nand II]